MFNISSKRKIQKSKTLFWVVLTVSCYCNHRLLNISPMNITFCCEKVVLWEAFEGGSIWPHFLGQASPFFRGAIIWELFESFPKIFFFWDEVIKWTHEVPGNLDWTQSFKVKWKVFCCDECANFIRGGVEEIKHTKWLIYYPAKEQNIKLLLGGLFNFIKPGLRVNFVVKNVC